MGSYLSTCFEGSYLAKFVSGVRAQVQKYPGPVRFLFRTVVYYCVVQIITTLIAGIVVRNLMDYNGELECRHYPGDALQMVFDISNMTQVVLLSTYPVHLCISALE